MWVVAPSGSCRLKKKVVGGLLSFPDGTVKKAYLRRSGGARCPLQLYDG